MATPTTPTPAAPIDPSAPYHVIDRQTGWVIRTFTYAQRNAARRLVDRLDNEYGAVRYMTALDVMGR